MSRSILRDRLLTLVALTFVGASRVVAESPAVTAPAIVCLHTEWLPTQNEVKGVLPHLLARELGRQAVLIAARDELGLATRDETLGEQFPESTTQQKQDLLVRVCSYKDGTTRIDLAPSTNPDELTGNADKQANYDPNAVLLLADSYETMTRQELPEKLRGWKFSGKAPAVDETNKPSDSIEGLLLEMNYISQFAAVRAAHTAIAEKGQSRAWLAVLARGYAQLTMMTEHHWKADSQVFAARALLYAMRLAKANPTDPWSHAHLAYVEAIVGLHSAALKEVDHVEELNKSASEPASMPGWFDLVRPFCSFEREPVLAAVTQRKSLRELAQRLSFQQFRAFNDDHWTFDSGRQTLTICPEDYSVYAALASTDLPLGVKRTGAFGAPAAFAHFLPPRIAGLTDVPKAALNAANGLAKGEKKEAIPEDNEEGSGDFGGRSAATATNIVRALRAATASGQDKSEPSWSVLGEIIFEEQFVQAANYLEVAKDATESSFVAEVESIQPAVEGHRYASFIDSHAVNRRTDSERYNQIVGNIVIVDPRSTLRPMLIDLWRINDGKGGKDAGLNGAKAALHNCDLTYNQLLAAQTAFGPTFWNYIEPWQRERRTEEFRAISPHSPQTLRLATALVEKPAYEQAREWETVAGEDPHAYIRLASVYAALKLYDDAIRCAERSIELCPSKEALVLLANIYRSNQQEDLWQPTLERVFEVEPLGLEHASVHNMIADGLMSKGKWDDAESHAVAAAASYSVFGLQSAVDVYEGRQRFDESEKFVRAISQSYPTYSGEQWFFWCLRTGHGDLKAARVLADKYFAERDPGDDEATREKFLLYGIAVNDLPLAQKHAKFLFDRHNRKNAVMPTRAYLSLQAAELAHEMKDDAAEKQPLNVARRTFDLLKESNPDLSNIVQFNCRLLDGKPIGKKGREGIDNHLAAEGVTDSQRCGFEYLIGRAYELHDDSESAATYYGRALGRFRSNRDAATLAGMRLHALEKAKAGDDAKK